MPMLLTKMSASGCSASSRAQPSAVPTSQATPCAETPGAAAASLATAASTAAGRRPLMTTDAPANASVLAISNPTPAVEPVITAFFPERSAFMKLP